MSDRAGKPISQMSSRLMKILHDVRPSPSKDPSSPGGVEFTIAEDSDISCKRVYGESRKGCKQTLEELREIERHRRMLLLRAELPFWRIIICWTGTCLSQVVTDSLIWCTLVTYISIRISAHAIDYVPSSIEALSQDNNIAILGGFLSFFLVLFVNQTNERFFQMYRLSKACSGRIQDVAGLAKAQLPPELADRLVRHINAAQIAGYVGLNAIGHGCPYSKAHFFDHYNSQYNLLTADEMNILQHHDMEYSALYMKELVTWCQLDLALARKEGHIDRYQEKQMNDCILQFRASMDGIYDYTDQPPHFFYIHFLVLLSAIYLPLFAIDTAVAAGWGEDKYIGLDIMNFIIVLLQGIFVVGLRSLGTKMIDPYGDDLEDLSVILYVESTLENCSAIMNSTQPDYSNFRDLDS
ncbi:hypothetical protein HJC23_012711 [Cyclotella cryptica]|uniref:Odorant receptor n=1 Tax=Cyclotella cryptica TaxID=29204 RepID=A0ABD3PNU5_9STRA|eukprot:CCRYP_013369-RA/>CCRYP_013369-RA protein AED:0.00 eAED:0.00 QI:360/1/1/1/1/1/2/67/409